MITEGGHSMVLAEAKLLVRTPLLLLLERGLINTYL